MQKKLSEFAAGMGLNVTPAAVDLLVQYAELVWQKKDMLNLTSVADKNEIFTRHICDGLAGAACLTSHAIGEENFQAADLGAGAGYIGITAAIVCPGVHITLVESLQKRCAFLNWIVMKLGLINVTVENIRLGQQPIGPFKLVTERAMGPLPDILPLAASCLGPGGVFIAYQSHPSALDQALLAHWELTEETPVVYQLPGETQKRYLMRFRA